MEGTFPILSEELVSAGWLVTRISFLNTWNSRKSVSKPSPAGSRGRDRAQGKGRKRERGEIGPEVNRHPQPHPHALHAFSPAGLLRGIAGGQVPQGPRDTQLPGESGGGKGEHGTGSAPLFLPPHWVFSIQAETPHTSPRRWNWRVTGMSKQKSC